MQTNINDRNFYRYHIALNTMHSKHKHRDMIEQNASTMTV